MKRITIKDIARELGIHHSTVSRALRGNAKINAATAEKVIKYASERGYLINRNALHLRGTASNIIGVVVPNIHHSFFSNYVSIITRLAYSSVYIVAVFQSEESMVREEEIIKSIIQQNIAGVLVSLSMETTTVSHLTQLDKYKIPLVCFDRVSPLLSKPAVVLDNRLALSRTVERLQVNGFSKIAYLSGIPSVHLFSERQEGYRQGVKAEGIQYENCVVMSNGFTVQQGYEATMQLFGEKDKPDALIFDSHLLAWGAIQYMRTGKKKLLDKMAFASFGGYPWLSYAVPNSVMIQQPEEKMAEASFRLLMEELANPGANEGQILKFDADLY